MQRRKGNVKASSESPPRVKELAAALDRIAPNALAQLWDNVGLLVGDPQAEVRSVLLCIDLTPEVATEATTFGVQLVIAYHPPLFKPISRLLADSRGTDAQIFACILNGIAIYALHTALDAAESGTNDVLAELCGIKESHPIEWVPEPGDGRFKVVTFVPKNAVDSVADAMAAQGAGGIGEYQKCSFRSAGRGTFQGSDSSHPVVGKAGVFETVDEVRLEMIVSEAALSNVMGALRTAHPYEEPAFDIYSLHKPPMAGIGRWGLLAEGSTLGGLAGKLKRSLKANCVQIVGAKSDPIRRAIIVAGAGGSIPFKVGLEPRDVIVTGELRHHDALTIQRHGASAIILNHWTSERPVLAHVRARLLQQYPSVKFRVSETDQEPFASL